MQQGGHKTMDCLSGKGHGKNVAEKSYILFFYFKEISLWPEVSIPPVF